MGKLLMMIFILLLPTSGHVENLMFDESIVSVKSSYTHFYASLIITQQGTGKLFIAKGNHTMECQVIVNNLSGNIRLSTGAKDFEPARGYQTSFDLTIRDCSQPMLKNKLDINIRKYGALHISPRTGMDIPEASLHFITNELPVANDIIIWNREGVAQLARGFKEL